MWKTELDESDKCAGCVASKGKDQQRRKSTLKRKVSDLCRVTLRDNTDKKTESGKDIGRTRLSETKVKKKRQHTRRVGEERRCRYQLPVGVENQSGTHFHKRDQCVKREGVVIRAQEGHQRFRGGAAKGERLGMRGCT